MKKDRFTFKGESKEEELLRFINFVEESEEEPDPPEEEALLAALSPSYEIYSPTDECFAAFTRYPDLFKVYAEGKTQDHARYTVVNCHSPMCVTAQISEWDQWYNYCPKCHEEKILSDYLCGKCRFGS